MGFFSKLTRGIGRVAQTIVQNPIPTALAATGNYGMAATTFASSRKSKVSAIGDLLSRSGLTSVGGFVSGYSNLMTDSGDPVYEDPGAGASGGGTVRTAAGGNMPMAGRMGGVARMIGNLVYSAAGKVRGVMLKSGQFLTTKRAAALARNVGLEAAAVALGIGVAELAQLVLSDAQKKGNRRGRSITARDVRTTTRTINKVERLHHKIADIARSAGACVSPRYAARRPRTFGHPHEAHHLRAVR